MTVQPGPEAPQRTFYEQVGGHETFVRLVDVFYNGVAADPVLRPMYPEEDLTAAKERLRMRHAPFRVDPDARDRWLAHMREAVASLRLAPMLESTLWDYLERAAWSMVNTIE